MDNPKLKKFIECYLPMTKCNMHCEYCYIFEHKNSGEEFCDLSKCLQYAASVFSQEHMGGTCLFNICAAGETLLHPDLSKLAHIILSNGHYLMLVTNGTLTERIKEYCSFENDLKERLFFKISIHYLELKRLKMLDKFFDNIKTIKEAGISYTVELTPDDSYIPYIDEIKDVCRERLGALCHVTVPRDERKKDYPLMTGLSREEFKETWKSFNSDLFDFKESIFEIKRNEFCYAGKWSMVINLSTGDYSQCYKGRRLGNLFDYPTGKLNTNAIGNHCQEGHCFNGHAFLGFGLIPEIHSPTFADMRNRTLPDGNQWLGEKMSSFMSQKLYNNNTQYNWVEKKLANAENYIIRAKNKFARILKD